MERRIKDASSLAGPWLRPLRLAAPLCRLCRPWADAAPRGRKAKRGQVGAASFKEIPSEQ